VDERRLSYALAAEHYDLGLETVCHGGTFAVAREVGLVCVYLSVVLGGRCAGLFLFLLFRACGCPGGCFGDNKKKVIAE
jgi:hypothetical protein